MSDLDGLGEIRSQFAGWLLVTATRRETVDLLVVGGGIYGSAVLYEASRRCLSALLVERNDFGAGASQNSLKIAHGGLRYLNDFDFGRVRQSIEERRRLLQIAPHLVRPLRCRLDVEPLSALRRLQFRAGLKLNDWFGRHCNRGVPTSNHLNRGRYPCWSDALIEDTERLLLGLIDWAVNVGPGSCRALNYTVVDKWLRRDRRVVGARLSNGEEIRAGAVIDCTGVSRTGQPACLSMNLVTRPLRLVAHGEAMALRHPLENRYVFVVPWRGRTMIGTYDRDYEGDATQPARLEPEHARELLEWVRPVHPELEALAADDICLVHYGLLPKDRPGDGKPSKRYQVRQEPDGRIRVVGVKYTTARGIASLAIQKAAEILGRDPLPDRFDEALPVLRNHRDVVRDAIGGDSALAEPLCAELPDLPIGAIAHAIEREQARTLADVLFRRTGLAAGGHPGRRVVEATADVMAERLGWSASDRRDQIRSFDTDPHFILCGPYRGSG